MGDRQTIGSTGKENLLINEIAFIGDSRNYYGQRNYYRTASTLDNKNVQLFFDGVGHDILTGTSGTLEFRASDKAFRWTAPSDTAGAWVALGSAGWMTLQSGTPNKELHVATQIYSNMPLTDQTITVDITTTSAVKYIGNNSPAMVQVYGRLRCNQPYKMLGIGGLKTIGMVEAIPYLTTVAGGKGGVDVIRIGTNDISDGTISSATMIANATTIFNNRLAIGRKLIICGEPARWGVNTSTALTAQQLSNLIALNKFYKDFANSNPSTCIYLDFYGLSVDPNYTDGRPYTNYLRDVVHDGIQGALEFGNAIYTTLKTFGFQGDTNYPTRGDTSNIFPVGSMAGTTGTIGTGASGTVRTGYSLSRSSGSDATVVGAVYTRLSPHKALGQTITVTGITAGNIIKFRSLGLTLAALGWTAGDNIQWAVDLEVVSATNITSITMSMDFNDSPITSNEIDFIPLANGNVRLKSNEMVIPAGLTGANTVGFNLLITVGASSTAVINVADITTKKLN